MHHIPLGPQMPPAAQTSDLPAFLLTFELEMLVLNPNKVSTWCHRATELSRILLPSYHIDALIPSKGHFPSFIGPSSPLLKPHPLIIRLLSQQTPAP